MHGLIFMEQYCVIWNCYDEVRESRGLWYTIMYDTSDKINTSLLKFVLLYEHLIIYENWTTPPPTLNKKRKTQSNKIFKKLSKRFMWYILCYSFENMAFVFESLSWIPYIFEYYRVIGYGLRKRESPIKVDSQTLHRC